MPLDSHQLKAFESVARLGSYSRAALELALTQPALSRRIQSLESELSLTVFFRTHSGVELTAAGFRLLTYVQSKNSLESDLISDLKGGTGTKEFAGTIRIAGYSTVLNHVITPALAPFLRKNPKAQLHFTATQGVRPPQRVFSLLERAEVDFIVLYRLPESPSLVSELLGQQELVSVESTRYPGRGDTFLDTRPEDATTTEFLAHQNSPGRINERSYLHDEEGILNGVLFGLGRAILLKSVVPKNAPLRKVRGLNNVKTPLYLHFRKSSFPTKLTARVREILIAECAKFLK